MSLGHECNKIHSSDSFRPAVAAGLEMKWNLSGRIFVKRIKKPNEQSMIVPILRFKLILV